MCDRDLRGHMAGLKRTRLMISIPWRNLPSPRSSLELKHNPYLPLLEAPSPGSPKTPNLAL